MTPRFNHPSWCLVTGLGLLLLSQSGLANEATTTAPKQNTLHRISLADAIDLAFAHNPDLAAASARIGQAEARVAEVAAGFYPQLTARAGYDYTSNPALAFSYIVAQRRFNANMADFNNQINNPGWVSNFRPELIGTINLYRGGQDNYLQKAAELGVKATELEHSALRNRLASAVTSAYYAVLSAPKQEQVAQRSVRTVEKEVELTRARMEEGAALRGDVLSLEVRSRAARESELQAKNNINLSRSALKTLIGEAKSELPELRETELPIPVMKDNLLALFDQAFSQRPEMQAAEHQVQIRQHELDAANGAIMPRVNAYAAYGANSQTPNPSGYKDNASIGINAEMDLFAGGAINARISGAERRRVEAEAVQEKTRLEIENEVRQAHSTLEQALERVKVAEAGVSSAEEALRLVNEQYHGGTATVSRYLEAETDRASANLRSIVARFEAQVAEAQLMQAVGHWR